MRKIIFGLLVLVTALFFSGMNPPSTFAQITITVPDNYSTIQLAINSALPGDTVYVRSGTYEEHITINKELILAGEDRETTVIDCNDTGKVIDVIASNVTISGLKITNGDRASILTYTAFLPITSRYGIQLLTPTFKVFERRISLIIPEFRSILV